LIADVLIFYQKVSFISFFKLQTFPDIFGIDTNNLSSYDQKQEQINYWKIKKMELNNQKITTLIAVTLDEMNKITGGTPVVPNIIIRPKKDCPPSP